MQLIQQITDDPLQTKTIILADGTSFDFTMYFRPMQYGWFITTLTYQDFALTEMRISNNSNMLYQFKNLIPFGLACYSNESREPSQQQDFLSGASKLYLLDEADVEAYAEYLSGR